MFWNKKKNAIVLIRKKGVVIAIVKKQFMKYIFFSASNKRYKVIINIVDNNFINISVDSEAEAFEILEDIKKQMKE